MSSRHFIETKSLDQLLLKKRKTKYLEAWILRDHCDTYCHALVSIHFSSIGTRKIFKAQVQVRRLIPLVCTDILHRKWSLVVSWWPQNFNEIFWGFSNKGYDHYSAEYLASIVKLLSLFDCYVHLQARALRCKRLQHLPFSQEQIYSQAFEGYWSVVSVGTLPWESKYWYTCALSDIYRGLIDWFIYTRSKYKGDT